MAPSPASTVIEPPSAPGVHPRPFWSLRPASDRQSGDAVVSNFLLHWFPAKIYKPSLDWSYSFWLGTVSAALLLVARPVRRPAAVPLRAVGRARLCVDQGHRVRRHVRLVDPLGAPLRRAPDGRRGVPAPGARVPDRRLQERHRAGPAARVELGDRRRDAAPDAAPVVHRLPAAVGPARVLGRHGRHQHRLVDSVRRADGARAAARRPRDRSADADPLLRAARASCCPARSACSSSITCGACARTAGSRAPTARRCLDRPHADAGRSRPRPTRCSASRAARAPTVSDADARGAGPDGQLGAGSHAARWRSSSSATIAVISLAGGIRALAARGSRPMRW